MHWRLLHEKAMALFYVEELRKQRQKRKMVARGVLPKWKSF
jgi:hypothetical protein